MTTDDPFGVLGLDRGATLDEVRAARRRLALHVHPDRGGDEGAMRTLNVAFDACVAHLTGHRPVPVAAAPRAPDPSSPIVPQSSPPGPPHRRIEHDSPSFTVDALPAETFEALLVALSWFGEVIDDDPPYVLECHLTEPGPCWCRLDVVPDAGGSTVSLAVASLDEHTTVSAEAVRDTWVMHLNRLGRPLP